MSAAARPLIQVRSAADGSEGKGQVALPAVFTAPIRPDIVHFVHTNMNKNKRQAYGVQVGWRAMNTAGHKHSAESWGTGRAVARIPRVSGGGTSRAGQAAFGNMCRKGRMFAPTQIWRKWHRKINTNQKRFAVASALAASALPSLVMARGHQISNVPEVPLVVSNEIESVEKTKKAIEILKAIGAYDDVVKAKNSKKIRSGTGKMRNRRHVMRRGPLIIYANDNGLTKAFRNLPGVELADVSRLNLLQLAPGGHLGRFCIWSQAAFEKVADLWGSLRRESSNKKGYTLPHNIITNADVTRLINSDEVQSKVRPAIKTVKRSKQKKNPLKNLGAKVALNPYALALRRSELLAQERRAAAKAASVSAARAQTTALRKAHKGRQSANYNNMVCDEFEPTTVEFKAKAAAKEVGASGSMPDAGNMQFDFTVGNDFSNVEGKAAPESKSAKKTEKFSLPKCLAYTKKFLANLKDDDIDPADFVQELEQRWRHVDVDESGLISEQELREAVWNNESDNKGKKMPKGKFPKALEDIVQDILNGTGNKDEFSFWDFVHYVLADREARDDIKVPVPKKSQAWAHA